MDRDRVENTSRGNNYKKGGMNVPEIKEYLIKMKVDTKQI
jgi:hypothetical protein